MVLAGEDALPCGSVGQRNSGIEREREKQTRGETLLRCPVAPCKHQGLCIKVSKRVMARVEGVGEHVCFKSYLRARVCLRASAHEKEQRQSQTSPLRAKPRKRHKQEPSRVAQCKSVRVYGGTPAHTQQQ